MWGCREGEVIRGCLGRRERERERERKREREREGEKVFNFFRGKRGVKCDFFL